MKALFQRDRGLHLWLLTDLGVLMLFWLTRGQRAWMNALADHVTNPLRQALGRLCAHTSLSVMEVLCFLLVLLCAGYLIFGIRSIWRADKERRLHQAYRLLLGAVCAGLTIYGGFCLLWGVNYYVDSFQDRSGIREQPVTAEELEQVTAYFAQQLTESSGAVRRDALGCFAEPREEILKHSPAVYDAVEQQFPFLEQEDPAVKAVRCSKIMSALDFTGIYCPFTGESSVNMDAPAALLPATAAHELAHQRGISSEQECNFLAILASTTSGDPAYQYSGWLMGWIYLGNALCATDADAWAALWERLPEPVRADLQAQNAYWTHYKNQPVRRASNTVYDRFLKSYGEPQGIRTYETVVNLLVTYYKISAAGM